MSDDTSQPVEVSYEELVQIIQELRAENDRLVDVLKTGSDLQDKLIVKTLEHERDLSDKLARSLRECIAGWEDEPSYRSDEYHHAEAVLYEYDKRRRMNSEWTDR